MEEVRAFVEGSEPVDIKLADRASAHDLIRRTLGFAYHGEGAKGLSGLSSGRRLSRAQLAHPAAGDRGGRRRSAKYANADIRLLAEVDAILRHRKVLFRVFARDFRPAATCTTWPIADVPGRAHDRGAEAAKVAIGERRRPDPRGRPGFLRVDTVHQGDLDGVKGVYHINLVARSPNWAVEAISASWSTWRG